MKRLKFLLTLVMICGWLAGPAQTTRYSFADESDFDNWTVIGTENASCWTWSAGKLLWNMPSTVPSTFPVLKYNEALSLTEGQYSLCANAATTGFNDDQGFEILLSTDPTFTDASAMKIVKSGDCYNTTFKDWPTGESDRIVTLEAGGTYYLGFRSSAKAGNYNSKAGGTLSVVYIAVEKIVDYPNAVTGVTVTPGQTIEPTATISWTWPTKTRGGSNVAEVGAYIYRAPDGSESNITDDQYLVATLPAESRTATKYTYEDNAANSGSKAPATSGKYHYAVVPFNNSGVNTAKPSTYSGWLGEDVKMGLLNNIDVTLQDINTVKIKFENNNIGNGANGGYIDTDKVKYKITRTSGSGTTTAIYTTELEYLDTELDGLDLYTYNVQGVYNDDEENATNPANVKYNCKNYVVAGGSISLNSPYIQTFDNAESMTIMPLIAPNSSYKWQFDSATQAAKFNGYGSSYSPLTSTLLTPPLDLKGGVPYKLTFYIWKASGTMTFAVKKGTSESSLTTVENVTVTGTASEKQKVEIPITMTEDGIGYIGFEATFTASSTLYLDDITIESTLVSPGAVTDVALAATPDETSDNKATLSFKLPAVTNAGVAIGDDDPALSNVKVTRRYYGDNNGNTSPEATELDVDTSDLTPGKAMSMADIVDEEGYYSYTISVEMENGTASVPVSTETLWIGYDSPRGVTGLSLNVPEDDKTKAVLTWSIYDTNLAQHGGYIDVENIKYRIYRSDSETPIAETQEQTWTDNTLLDENLVWGSYTYTVEVVNKNMASVPVESRAVVGGHAMEGLEITPDFSKEADTELWDRSAGWGAYQGNMRALNTKKDQNAMYLPPVVLADPGMLGSTITFTAYRESSEDDDYAVNGEVLDIYLYDLNEGDGEALEELMTRGAYIFPPVSNEILIASVNVTEPKEEKVTREIDFTVPATGKYRIGFKCQSEENRVLYIPELSIVFGNSESVKTPQAVTDLEAVRDEAGALKVQVSFTAPDLTTGDAELKRLSSVNVYRAQGDSDAPEYEVVKSFTGDECTPGMAVSFEDLVDAPDYYAYKVVSILDDVESEAAFAEKQWVGYDVPVTVENLTVTENGKDAVITWTPITRDGGVHGGYVDYNRLGYKVYRTDKEMPIATVGEGKATDRGLGDLAWNRYAYRVSVINGTYEGEKCDEASILMGDVMDGTTLDADLSEDNAADLWDCGGWIAENGELKAVGVTEENNAIYLPPFRVTDETTLGCYMALDMYAEDSMNAEQLSVYLIDMNDDEEDGGVSRGIRAYTAADGNMVGAVSVVATEATPHRVKFNLPGTGKYRIALKCTSADNRGLYLTALAMNIDVETGVESIGDSESLNVADGMVMLPEGAVNATVFTIGGQQVAVAGNGQNLDIRHLADGIYIIRIVYSDGRVSIAKVMK